MIRDQSTMDSLSPDTVGLLRRFSDILRLYIDDPAQDIPMLRTTAEALCRDSRVLSLAPERLLLIVKQDCFGCSSTGAETYVESSPASFRYHRGLDALWVAFFAARAVPA